MTSAPLGGSLRQTQFAVSMPQRRLLEQAWIAFALPPTRTGNESARDVPDDVRYWATVVRKLLQRGERPPLPPVAETALYSIARPVSDVTEEMVTAAVAGPDTSIDLDSDIELHEQWEQPFFDGLPVGLRRFVHPQVSLEALAGMRTGADGGSTSWWRLRGVRRRAWWRSMARVTLVLVVSTGNATSCSTPQAWSCSATTAVKLPTRMASCTSRCARCGSVAP